LRGVSKKKARERGHQKTLFVLLGGRGTSKVEFTVCEGKKGVRGLTPRARKKKMGFGAEGGEEK